MTFEGTVDDIDYDVLDNRTYSARDEVLQRTQLVGWLDKERQFVGAINTNSWDGIIS